MTKKYNKYESILADADKVRADYKQMHEQSGPVHIAGLSTKSYCEMIGLDGDDATHWRAGNYYAWLCFKSLLCRTRSVS
jgi:hypothetical protein